MNRGIRLRTKFLISLLAISSGLSAATLLVVSYSVDRRVRESLSEELGNSVKTFQTFDQQRETALARSAQLLANLPLVRALMTTDDTTTIQDASEGIWKLSGSDLLVLANRSGAVVGFQSKSNSVNRDKVQAWLRDSVQPGDSRIWWYGGGRLYQIWLQPIYFGADGQNRVIGILGVGHEIDASTAGDFSKVVSSEVVFRCGNAIVASTLPARDGQTDLFLTVAKTRPFADRYREVQIGNERYVETSVDLATAGAQPVTLSVLKSLDKATEFLNKLNRVLLTLGFVSVVAGGILVFLISHTFTRPLSNLVAGVHALESGDYSYPLDEKAGGEVGEVTVAFDRMRTSLRNTLAEQKLLEDKLRQAQKMEAVGRLAGGVAHDFNNLLTVIRGNGDLLLDRSGTDQLQQKYLHQIQKAADRAVSMTRQLLAFSRMQVLQPRVLDLNTTISEMNKMIPRLIGEHIEFTFHAGDCLLNVVADPGQIEQVFLNLAVNARDAMPNGGKLTVVTSNVKITEIDAQNRSPMPSGDYVLLAVSDTGHGMDAETKARIFEPFFTTKEVGKGTGLGLATVYGIVKQTGGFIWVESILGIGSTFEIYLPCSAKPATRTDTSSAPAVPPRGNETILLVEDETDVRELASEFLREGGYTVLEAHDGEAALGIVRNHGTSIHLLLTDVVMPRMNGRDLAQKVYELRPDIRVMFMTGYADFPDTHERQQKFEVGILQKPFSRSTLLEKMHKIMKSTPHTIA